MTINPIIIPNEFQGGTQARADKVNQNFEEFRDKTNEVITSLNGANDDISEINNNIALVNEIAEHAQELLEQMTQEALAAKNSANEAQEAADELIPYKDVPLITGEPTGFRNDVQVTYDPEARQVTLTGNVEAYAKGIKVDELTDGWTSPAHDDVNGTYYLYYNVDTQQIVFDTQVWDFKHILIAIVEYWQPWFAFALREVHGLVMDSATHEQEHEVTGTYRLAGGDLSGYALNDSENRQPDVSVTTVKDEDLKTELPLLNNKTYTQL